jgi:hypothetical protein
MRIKCLYMGKDVSRDFAESCGLHREPHSVVEFVSDDSHTHILFMNDSPIIDRDRRDIPVANVIGFSHEPFAIIGPQLLAPAFASFLRERAGRYVSPVTAGMPEPPAVSGYPFLLHDDMRAPGGVMLRDAAASPKRRRMSVIVSEKDFLPGHRHRRGLVAAILGTDMDVHVWGRDSESFRRTDAAAGGDGSRIRGGFAFGSGEPYDDYEFTVVVENCVEKNYVSEKFTNAVGRDCVPLYLGAPNAGDIFGPRCCVPLTGDLAADLAVVRRVYEHGLEPGEVDLDAARHELFRGRAYLPEYLARVLAH